MRTRVFLKYFVRACSVIVPIFFIENCTDAFQTLFINKNYGELSIRKKLRELSLITEQSTVEDQKVVILFQCTPPLLKEMASTKRNAGIKESFFLPRF